jgi:enoyl-[acyl-carrier protein] reductase I
MLELNLKGKRALIVGVGDDQGYGWAIAKSLAEAGATIIVGTWAPIYKIFTMGIEQGKFAASQKLADGSTLKFDRIYPVDAAYDTMDQVPLEVREHKRYRDLKDYAVADFTAAVVRDYGGVDIVVHSLANAPEIQKPLLDTSREGYTAAMSSSAYSLISLLAHFGPHMPKGSSALALSYLAAEKTIPGYGGGMSSAKAALESDIRTLAWECGRRFGMRVNAISAGALASRAARAIGFIEQMIAYSSANAPLSEELYAEDVGNTAAFLCTSLARAITGVTLHVDHGLHSMGVAVDSPVWQLK